MNNDAEFFALNSSWVGTIWRFSIIQAYFASWWLGTLDTNEKLSWASLENLFYMKVWNCIFCKDIQSSTGTHRILNERISQKSIRIVLCNTWFAVTLLLPPIKIHLFSTSMFSNLRKKEWNILWFFIHDLTWAWMSLTS